MSFKTRFLAIFCVLSLVMPQVQYARESTCSRIFSRAITVGALAALSYCCYKAYELHKNIQLWYKNQDNFLAQERRAHDALQEVSAQLEHNKAKLAEIRGKYAHTLDAIENKATTESAGSQQELDRYQKDMMSDLDTLYRMQQEIERDLERCRDIEASASTKLKAIAFAIDAHNYIAENNTLCEAIRAGCFVMRLAHLCQTEKESTEYGIITCTLQGRLMPKVTKIAHAADTNLRHVLSTMRDFLDKRYTQYRLALDALTEGENIAHNLGVQKHIQLGSTILRGYELTQDAIARCMQSIAEYRSKQTTV